MRIAIGIVAAAALAVASGATLRAQTDQSAQTGVATLLARSSHAWNHGDLDTFMQSYEQSPRTLYISSAAVVHGYAAIRARYAGHYSSGHMGNLSVSDLVVRPLGADYAAATARWHLARTKAAGGNVSGLFSLVLHRSAAGWHIILDHTP